MIEKSPVLMPQWVRERFPPDKRAAIEHLRRQIDEGMLREIAEADYAQDVKHRIAALPRSLAIRIDTARPENPIDPFPAVGYFSGQ